MESGRFLLAVVLMIAVVVLTNILLPPPRPAENESAPTGEVAATAPTDTAASLPAQALPTPPAARADSATLPPGDTVWASSPNWRFGFSTRGGALVSARMLGYQSFAAENDGQPVELVPAGSALLHHHLRVGDTDIDLSTLSFEPSSPEGVSLTGGSSTGVLELNYRDPDSGTGIQLTYTFHGDRYVFDVSARIIGADAGSSQLIIDIGPRLASNEAVPAEDDRALSFVSRNSETGIANFALARLRNQQIVNGPLTWFALKSKYFLAAAINDTSGSPFGGVIATPAGDHRASLAATLVPRDGEFHYRLYLGPQEPDRLAALGLQDVSVFGWRFLQPILRPLGHAITWALLQMHRALGLGYGWVLILFGFLIRVVLWPLNATAMRSQIKNMEIQPRIKEMQARYKSDPEKLQKEMARLWKEEGYNPMGGCLPMMLPFPVLIALFFVFQSTIEFRGVSFLWLPDLSRADPLFILPVALGISMFIQQFLNMRTMKDQPAQMKYMTYIMPVFMTLLFLRFASGLNLYYASMNIASVPQQLQIMKEKQKRLGTKR